jgi:hypothetical protein
MSRTDAILPPPNKRARKRTVRRILTCRTMSTLPLLVATLLTVLPLTACHRSDAPEELARRLNSVCDVSFRRGDALGAGSGNPVPALSDSQNGAEVTVGGKLVAVEAKGIVLRDEQHRRDHWIPFTSVLRISFAAPP